ncbi:hypothetical protein HYH03_016805 [Edaphochlamys debaryana]|uniref:Uncharacterized protein n=1 Tax=Edaphochlamys debaryana TaxID=47281 RepID=A0A836BPS1_9CHLO|nr:hypothetical protein HYH03_016805 [Edaphochlamys debaryana]|eukprot:KAG2484390.1 hypothetical protein HYH03_016805 [Edaphochlamys debaryana]
MLARYRSPSGLDLPRGSRARRTGNPIHQFADVVEEQRRRNEAAAPASGLAGLSLAEAAEAAATAPAAGGGAGEEPLGSELLLWDGPLAGVAHQAGQFAVLREGPGAEPPAELAEALAADLDLLAALADTTQDIMFDAGGSESDYAVVPIILEPRPQHAQQQQPGAAACGAGAGPGAGAGVWWSPREVSAVPLTWAEVAASLRIAPELAARMQAPEELATPEAFWSRMVDKYISRLGGGEELQEELLQQGMAGPRRAPEGQGPGGETSSAAAMAAAVRALGGAVSSPVLQVMLGSEALRWNPIPLAWVGRSKRSGAILGLITAVVWT